MSQAGREDKQGGVSGPLSHSRKGIRRATWQKRQKRQGQSGSIPAATLVKQRELSDLLSSPLGQGGP